MLIAIDLDGVTIASIRAWLRQFHPNTSVNEIKSYGAWKYVDGCDSYEQMMDEFDNINPKEVELIEDAFLCIKYLERYHEIFFLTSKREKMERWSKKVLKREKLDKIKFINNWTDGKGKNEYKFDILIDDSPEHANVEGCLLFSQPWNEYLDAKNRVNSWRHAIYEIEKLNLNK